MNYIVFSHQIFEAQPFDKLVQSLSEDVLAVSETCDVLLFIKQRLKKEASRVSLELCRCGIIDLLLSLLKRFPGETDLVVSNRVFLFLM